MNPAQWPRANRKRTAGCLHYSQSKNNRIDIVLKAIIFDWDLTLWNSWDNHVWLLQRTAETLGLPSPDPTAIAREYSRPFFEHLAWFFGGDLDSGQATYLKLYRETVSTMAGLYPGIPEMLLTLRDHGYRLALFSDKRDAFGLPELDQTGIGHLLDYTLFLVDGRPYKPDPSGLQVVMESLGVTPGETLYVGDGRQDIECAHRAGARSGAALWGSVDREALLARNPHYRWERTEQLPETLGVAEA